MKKIEWVSLVISLIGIGISLYTFIKNKNDESFRYELQLISINSPEKLNSPKLGVIYVEAVLTNKSTLPLVLVSSTLKAEKVGIVNIDQTFNAFLFKTLISTKKETSGNKVVKEIEHFSDGLPLTIPPKDAKHFILAYEAPNVLGVSSENTTLEISLFTNRERVITIDAESTAKVMKSTEQFLIGRYRAAN